MDYSFFDSCVVDVWYQILRNSRSAVVILCALDYFNCCPFEKLPIDYQETLLSMLKIRNKKILKNQIYINLILLDEFNEKFKMLLFSSLKATKDWKSISRVISNLGNFNSRKIVREIKNQIKDLNLDFLDDKLKETLLKKVR